MKQKQSWLSLAVAHLVLVRPLTSRRRRRK
jgi:hypothetical protein